MRNKRFIGLFLTLVTLVSLGGCKNQAQKASDTAIEDMTDVKTDELLAYKDSYVGDNSAVVNIVSELPGNQYQPMFELQTKEEPYEIAIRYQVNPELADENDLNFWNERNPKTFFEDHSIVLFALIPNVEIIEFEIDGLADLADYSYVYTRKELEAKYVRDLTEISSSEDSFNAFFERD